MTRKNNLASTMADLRYFTEQNGVFYRPEPFFGYKWPENS